MMAPMRMPKPDDDVIARKAEIVEALRRIVPGEGVVAEDAALAVYESDGLTAYRQRPLVVVLPETTAQVPTEKQRNQRRSDSPRKSHSRTQRRNVRNLSTVVARRPRKHYSAGGSRRRCLFSG